MISGGGSFPPLMSGCATGGRAGQGLYYPFPGGHGSGVELPTADENCALPPGGWPDHGGLQGQPVQVGAAAAAVLVPDPVQVSARWGR